MLPRPKRSATMSMRRLVASREYREVINFAFVGKPGKDFCANTDPVRLANPDRQPDERDALQPDRGLVANLSPTASARPTAFAGLRDRPLLPAAMRPAKPSGRLHQPAAAAGSGFARPEQWARTSRNVDFFDLKADLEALLLPRVAEFERAAHPALHPGRSARVLLDGREIGLSATASRVGAALRTGHRAGGLRRSNSMRCGIP